MFEQDAKDQYESLASPISSEFAGTVDNDVRKKAHGNITGLFYINAYGMEIHPSPNADYLANLGEREVLIYSCGSLWTRSVKTQRTGFNPNLKAVLLVSSRVWPSEVLPLVLHVRPSFARRFFCVSELRFLWQPRVH